MKTKVRCQARNPETCPHHGIPIHKQYHSNVVDANVEEFLLRKELENQHKQSVYGERIPLKEMNANELADELRRTSVTEDWLQEDLLNASIELAWILHANQVRGSRGDFRNTPYIEHPLRNAVRLARLGVKDKDIIIAAVLHDTIEDGAQDYLQKVAGKANQPEPEARETLSEHIEKEYGAKVLTLVQAVTNDYMADTDKQKRTTEQKNSTYLNHVSESIKNKPGVILVKISDFIDNAMSLHHHEYTARRAKTIQQSKKYLPVVDIFINELERTKLPIPEKQQKRLIIDMQTTRTRLQNIINRETA